MKIVGVDLSLTSTGLATSGDSHRIETTNAWPITLRQNHIALKVAKACADADAVVLEVLPPANKMRFTALYSERAGLYWMVRAKLEEQLPSRAGLGLLDVKNLKLYATGDGGADKAKVVEAARWHWGNYLSDDEADAKWLAAVGHHVLGDPIAALPPEHTRALSALTWIRPPDPAAIRLRQARRALGAAR